MSLYLGLLLFGGVHLWSMLLPTQARGLKAAGEGRYMGLYSLISVIGLALMAYGYWQGRSGPASLESFYEPMSHLKQLAFLLIFIGFVLIFSNKSKGYIGRYLHHPFSIGVILWSSAHLLMNGERAVVLIFALFWLVAVLDVVLSFARGKYTDHKPNILHDVRSLVVGTILYLVFMFGFHPYILNIPVT